VENIEWDRMWEEESEGIPVNARRRSFRILGVSAEAFYQATPITSQNGNS
jgi:hypothetical protein